jgi:hypothetical protein
MQKQHLPPSGPFPWPRWILSCDGPQLQRFDPSVFFEQRAQPPFASAAPARPHARARRSLTDRGQVVVAGSQRPGSRIREGRGARWLLSWPGPWPGGRWQMVVGRVVSRGFLRQTREVGRDAKAKRVRRGQPRFLGWFDCWLRRRHCRPGPAGWLDSFTLFFCFSFRLSRDGVGSGPHLP